MPILREKPMLNFEPEDLETAIEHVMTWIHWVVVYVGACNVIDKLKGKPAKRDDSKDDSPPDKQP
jgi:hypothetical protein